MIDDIDDDIDLAELAAPDLGVPWSPRPLVLFRKDFYTRGEISVVAGIFDTRRNNRAFYADEEGLTNRLVIARFCIMPDPEIGLSFVEDARHYHRLEAVLRKHGSRLVNTYAMHRWIAGFDYYDLIKDYTFETWFDIGELPDDGTRFVIKGKTTGRKEHWPTRMFCDSKDDAIRAALELGADPVVGPQGLVFRRFTELVTYQYSIHGFPLTNEWRFFCYKNHILDYGYIWTWSRAGYENCQMNDKGLELAQKIAEMCAAHVHFFNIDIAEKPDGEWIVVELNDAQASGISIDNNAEKLYGNLKDCLLRELMPPPG